MHPCRLPCQIKKLIKTVNHFTFQNSSPFQGILPWSRFIALLITGRNHIRFIPENQTLYILFINRKAFFQKTAEFFG